MPLELKIIFLPVLFSFVFTVIGTLLALKFFPKMGLMDRPEKYGLSRSPIPYSGGIILFFSFVLSTLLFIDIDTKVFSLLLGAFLVTFISFLDDRFSLSPWLRLLVQAGVGVLVVLGGTKIQLLRNPFGDPILLDSIKFSLFGQELWLFSLIFIVLWLVLMMNVMNWLDGIQGLSSGVGMIASVVLFVFSLRGFHTVDQSTITIFSISLAASLLAFLIFEFPPAKILFGDTGSMFLGYLLGMFAIFAGGKVATVLLIMGFPVLDALWVILRRILTGKSPLRGDYKHFHHRLLRVGLSERKALFMNYALAAFFGLLALSTATPWGKLIALLAVFILMIAIGSGVYFLEKNRQK